MTAKEKRTLVMAAFIGTLLGRYADEEKTALHRKLQLRVKKGVNKKAKSDFNTVLHLVDDKGVAGSLWRDAVNYFADQEITIEASQTVLSIVALDEKALSKHYGMGKGVLSFWAKPSKRKDAIELEKQSRIVAEYLYKITSEYFSIEIEQRKSVLEMIKEFKAVA